MYTGRAIPGHAKDPTRPVDKSREIKPGVIGQIRQQRRHAVKLHQHLNVCMCDILRSRIVEAGTCEWMLID